MFTWVYMCVLVCVKVRNQLQVSFCRLHLPYFQIFITYRVYLTDLSLPGLELTVIYMPLPPECWNKDLQYDAQLTLFF